MDREINDVYCLKCKERYSGLALIALDSSISLVPNGDWVGIRCTKCGHMQRVRHEIDIKETLYYSEIPDES